MKYGGACHGSDENTLRKKAILNKPLAGETGKILSLMGRKMDSTGGRVPKNTSFDNKKVGKNPESRLLFPQTGTTADKQACPQKQRQTRPIAAEHWHRNQIQNGVQSDADPFGCVNSEDVGDDQQQCQQQSPQTDQANLPQQFFVIFADAPVQQQDAGNVKSQGYQPQQDMQKQISFGDKSQPGAHSIQSKPENIQIFYFQNHVPP